ncbi:UDP-N-acetylglucosamine--N-acetylmuramyl-(pentapeptide) pyrophosphoryl-undecaprenol N-acetylglucosamine transferase [Candidatus Gracilibacteria bacterium]|nr:UDP-N-acetylglucosamine--N-acetylmuramyl-(pentapeptide) pyrophosphoryl-undecaprenol N-acetylglucosamine transferase [Candidatus Gracilibacteria bacterium]
MQKKLTETLSKYTKIVLIGGGTGGHIQPIVSIVRILECRKVGILDSPKFLWLGGSNSQEEKTARENDIVFDTISTLKLSTTTSPKILLYPFVLVKGIIEARQILSKIKNSNTPTLQHSICLFSKGGPGSVAIGVAGWSLGIPLYIHESDTIPGRSNRILGKLAKRIFLGFESASKYFNERKCEVVGQILDPVFYRYCEAGAYPAQWESNPENNKENFISTGSPSFTRDHGNKIHWKTTKPHILVICGSQGSRSIFEEIIKKYSDHNEYEWIIALGRLNSGMKDTFAKMNNCQAEEWISQADLASLIYKADLAITRASATTLAELTIFSNSQPHLIMIPLPYSAGNHQYYNAIEYQKVGHSLLEQKNIHKLTEIITQHVKHNS